MMQLPSEHTSSWETLILAGIGTIGAGGLLKIFTEWQAGRTAIRVETTMRIRQLEEQVGQLQKDMGDVREQKGRLEAALAAANVQVANLQAQLAQSKS